MQSVFKFQPIYKERPWGGGRIARVGASRQLPPNRKIGEAWEIADRPGDESVIAAGALAGRSIRWLLAEHGAFVMGRSWGKERRFPLLVKILDARERLSLQVHPPAAAAAELGGEPKTEMWYLLAATPAAAIWAGLRRGVQRAGVVAALRDGPLEPLLCRIPVRKGDAILIPSGRLHAIDAGCLILEIQQNSDTTYRLDDWGRVGLDGKPRELHIEQALRCVDFQDFEPQLVKRQPGTGVRPLAESGQFRVEAWKMDQTEQLDGKTPVIVHITSGSLAILSDNGETATVQKGETALLAATVQRLVPEGGSAAVIVTTCLAG